MIPIEEAQARLLAIASPLPPQILPLDLAVGHYLAEDIITKRSQPAADLSAMDGYAIRFADLPGPFDVIGESAAGRPYSGRIEVRQAVRIFTGAHVPGGGDTILIQEDASVADPRLLLSAEGPGTIGKHIRPAGADFCLGDTLLARGAKLTPGAIAAAAMGGFGQLAVGSMPKIAIIASGDELMPPGEMCDAAHIPSSNNVMLVAMLRSLPCEVHDKGIVDDDLNKLTAAFANTTSFDVVITSGGASVGDHDQVQAALVAAGAEIAFWRVAIRPGQPIMAGRLGKTLVLGLPGNPSSAFVTAFLFLLPLVRYLAGSNAPLPLVHLAPVGIDIKAVDNRAEYMRARLENGIITPFGRQDSGMVSPLVEADALLIRPAFAPPLQIGELAPYMAL